MGFRKIYSNWRKRVWNMRTHKAIRKSFPEQKHIIKYAFTIAGVDYYQFDDIFQLPFERALIAIAIYEETRMNCSREYLEQHVEAIGVQLRQNPIDVFAINTLNEQLQERLKLSFDIPLLYKLASVVFFDKNENPCVYEPEYNVKKIEAWQQHKGVADFFLQMPVSELIPFLQPQEYDLAAYSAANARLNEIHSERLQVLSSKKQ